MIDCGLRDVGAVNVNVTVRLASELSAARFLANVPIFGTVNRTVVAAAEVGPIFFTVADTVTVSPASYSDLSPESAVTVRSGSAITGTSGIVAFVALGNSAGGIRRGRYRYIPRR